MSKIEEDITKLITSNLEHMSYELYGVEYLVLGKKNLLRVYIDSDLGINLDDCEKVSKLISAILDVNSPINNAYTLEVSSPGIERKLFKIEHYEKCLNNEIKLKTKIPVDGQRNFKGLIVEVDNMNNCFYLQVYEKIIKFNFVDIDKANLIANF